MDAMQQAGMTTKLFKSIQAMLANIHAYTSIPVERK